MKEFKYLAHDPRPAISWKIFTIVKDALQVRIPTLLHQKTIRRRGFFSNGITKKARFPAPLSSTFPLPFNSLNGKAIYSTVGQRKCHRRIIPFHRPAGLFQPTIRLLKNASRKNSGRFGSQKDESEEAKNKKINKINLKRKSFTLMLFYNNTGKKFARFNR